MLRRCLLRYHYNTMTPEDYLFNQRDSNLARTLHSKGLGVLENSNQGPPNVTDEVTLVGVPKGMYREPAQGFDSFMARMRLLKPDLIVLQIDPSEYIARERWAAHKCALKKMQDYYLDGVQKIDPLKPHTWQQTVVNLLTLDMITQNKVPEQMNYRRGLYSFSYPYLQDDGANKQLTQPFINTISTHVLGGKRTGYNFIDKVLYTALMGKQKVMLGGMPETLSRLILGNSLSIHELRDVFRFVLARNKELTVPMATKDATENFLPHIFQLPKDLYMTAIIKEAFQASVEMLACVGIEHWRPIQEYWVGSPHGINYTEATNIPERMEGESDQDLIEKQAIMDVLLESRVWGKNYLSNPFPYLIDDITKVSDKDAGHLKALFKKHYSKYRLFKDKETKMLDGSAQAPVAQLEGAQAERVAEEVGKVQQSIAGGPQLKKYKFASMKHKKPEN